MPMKEPDVWAMIIAWLQLNFGNGTIHSAGAAIFYVAFKNGIYAEETCISLRIY